MVDGRRQSVRRSVSALIVTVCASALANSAEAADGGAGDIRAYQPGDGWTVPHTDLTVGGYASSALTKETSAPWTLDLSHLSLFLWWSGDSRLRFFSETDLEHSVVCSHSSVHDGGRIVDSLLGKHVKVRRSAILPVATRLMLGDDSEVELG